MIMWKSSSQILNKVYASLLQVLNTIKGGGDWEWGTILSPRVRLKITTHWYIAPQMEHSFLFLKLYIKVTSHWKFACA